MRGSMTLSLFLGLPPAHAVVPCGIRVVVRVVVGAYHAAMIAICPMDPTVWLSISVGDVFRSAPSVRAAGAVGQAAAAGFTSIPMVLVASPLLFLISPLLPCPSAIIAVVLIIIICLGRCGILGRCSICICCFVLLHHD